MSLAHAWNRSTLRRKSAGPLIGALLLGLLLGCGGDPANDATTGQGDNSGGSVERDRTSMPPWPAPTDVPARVASAGLDLGPMGTAEHYHPKLRIIIDGKDVPIPANIGVDPTTGAMSAVHTHETDGTIHIEADTAGETFTLGQLFTQWGVTLTRKQIGGVTAQDGQKVDVTSNAGPVAGDPRDLRLEPDQVIVLRMP